MADTVWPDTFVPFHELKKYGIDFCRRWVNAMIDKGQFPLPYQISTNRIAWKRSDIELFLSTRPTVREAPPVLWPVRDPAEPKRPVSQSRAPGRRPGGRVVTGADGKRRYVVPAPPAAE